MHRNDFCGSFADSLQTMKHGLGSGRATRYHFGKFPKTEFIGERKKTSGLLRRNDDYDLLYGVTLLEGFECMEENGSTGQLQELLGPLASHPRALPGGGYDCDIHKKDGRRTTDDGRKILSRVDGGPPVTEQDITRSTVVRRPSSVVLRSSVGFTIPS
jgi:hypothetical protein